MSKKLLNRLKKPDSNFMAATKTLKENIQKTVSDRKKISFFYKMKRELSFWGKILKFLDIPSGSVLGLFTLQIWIMMWITFFTHYDIKTSILTAYGSVLTSFTIHGVTKIVKNQDDGNE